MGEVANGAVVGNGKGTSSTTENPSLVHAWFFEPKPSPRHGNKGNGVLTTAGLENIASHKYKAGTYTHLDNFLNPVWAALTELLPRWLAPNMVTTLGGLHCGIAYTILWHYSPNFDTDIPNWVILLSGYCTIAYYTLDCMDGKQARRIGASSPLGQLFDHGFDCICNLFHCANVAGFLMTGGSYWYLVHQCSLQFAFFMAQWEEYYTGTLPHSNGKWFGVTEVIYGLAIGTIHQSFINRTEYWHRPLATVLSPSVKSILALPHPVATLELRYVAIAGWTTVSIILMLCSLIRVNAHITNHTVRFSALSKLLSPLLLGIAPFLLPSNLIQHNTRYMSVATGLAYSLITKKIIVFSMAKMTFATIQFDVVPYVLACVWIRYDVNLTEHGANTVLGLFCLIHAWRLMKWTSVAIDQICDRLGIYCLSVKKKEKKI